MYPVSWLLSQVSGIRVQDRMFSSRCRGGVQGAVHTTAFKGAGIRGRAGNTVARP